MKLGSGPQASLDSRRRRGRLRRRHLVPSRRRRRRRLPEFLAAKFVATPLLMAKVLPAAKSAATLPVEAQLLLVKPAHDPEPGQEAAARRALAQVLAVKLRSR